MQTLNLHNLSVADFLESIQANITHSPDEPIINPDGTPTVIPPVFLRLPGHAAAPPPGEEPIPAADARAGPLPDAHRAVPLELAAHPPQQDAAVRPGKEISSTLKPPAPHLLPEGIIISDALRGAHYGPFTPELAQAACDVFVKYNFHNGTGPTTEQNRLADLLKHLSRASVMRDTFVPPNGTCIAPGKQNEATKTYNEAKDLQETFLALGSIQALLTRDDLGMDQDHALALATQTLEQLLITLSRKYADKHVERVQLLSTHIPI